MSAPSFETLAHGLREGGHGGQGTDCDAEYLQLGELRGGLRVDRVIRGGGGGGGGSGRSRLRAVRQGGRRGRRAVFDEEALLVCGTLGVDAIGARHLALDGVGEVNAAIIGGRAGREGEGGTSARWGTSARGRTRAMRGGEIMLQRVEETRR